MQESDWMDKKTFLVKINFQIPLTTLNINTLIRLPYVNRVNYKGSRW